MTLIGVEDPDPMDSGFGPFALTRLCVETGGMYFTVHPNRKTNRRTGRGEIADFSAHLKYFFDPEVMVRYKPDYVSTQSYMRQIAESPMRTALVRAAELSGIAQLEAPQLRFVKRSDAELSAALTEAQKAAAVLEPRLLALYETLLQGEAARKEEIIWRWQASYDLAMGRVLASKVRTEGYNAMLAQAKRGLAFKNPKNNTWVLRPANEVTVGSRMAKEAEQATQYLQRVIREHPGTPWELLSRRELDSPLGWKWVEEYTELAPPPSAPAGNNNAAPPSNDRARSIATPPPKRPLPKL
jgi:hypothetical protein